MSSIFDRIKDPVEADKQRLRRSEVLLTQLYRNEIRPRFRVPDMRGVKIMAYFSVLAFVIFTGTLFYKFNAFIMLREDAMSKAGNLESAIQRRSNLFSNLINLTLNHASLEHSVFTSTARMRTEIIKKSDLSPAAIEKLLAKTGTGGKGGGVLPTDWNKALEALQGATAAASLGQLLAIVEQYPNIQSSDTYQQAMASLVDMEDLIATRRIEYNTSLREYNTQISKFPWKILAEWTNFQRFEYYSTDSSGTAGPLITKDIYKQLFPLNEDGGVKE
ncbi:MAG: magnetosome protein MamQ [Rhodospirillales bacterium]